MTLYKELDNSEDPGVKRQVSISLKIDLPKLSVCKISWCGSCLQTAAAVAAVVAAVVDVDNYEDSQIK
jgi:hypothetical protein